MATDAVKARGIRGTSLAVPAVVSRLVAGRATLDPRIILPDIFLSVQFGAIALFVISIGLLFAGVDLLRDHRARTWLMAAIVLTGTCWLALGALGIDARVLSVHGLFGVWFVAICWANGLCNCDLPRWLRWCLAGLALAYIAER